MPSDPFVGEIVPWAGNFAPTGWAFCGGQLLDISQNSALFSLLGTMYGGDGRTTFGLPDLRGRVALGMGQGPGLSNYPQGQKGGPESIPVSSGSTFPVEPGERHTTGLKSGESGAYDNRQPYLAISFCISLIGTYPST